MAKGTGNWITETCITVGTGDLSLTGQNLGYNRFKGAVPAGTVWYEIIDGDNREAGLGTFDGNFTIERTEVHATLVGNVYDNSSPQPITLTGNALVASTFNAEAYEELHDHSVDLTNPHAVTKSQVGLGSVDDTSDADKPISDATQLELDEKAEWKGDWIFFGYSKGNIVKRGTSTYVANTSTYEEPPHATWDLMNSDGVSDVTNIYDGVDSTATDQALSANQGKYLNDLITSDINLDGGASGAVYLASQNFDGGNA